MQCIASNEEGCAAVIAGKQGERGLPGKDGKDGKDSKALDKEYIAAQMAKFVKEFDQKIAAVDTAAKKGNAEALKHVSDVSIKLGNQIQSAAKDLHHQIRAVEQSAHKKIESTEKAIAKQISEVRKMEGPRGAPGKEGARGPQGAAGAAGARGPQGVAGERGAPGKEGARGPEGAQGAAGARGPQGVAGERGAPGAQGPAGAKGEADLSLVDVCGVIGGSDSTCSRNPGQGHAYSVGDPHYKTWDNAQGKAQEPTKCKSIGLNLM